MKIIHAIAKRNIIYFFNLSFERIHLSFEDKGLSVSFEKDSKEENKILTARQGGRKLFSISKDDISKHLRYSLRRNRIAVDKYIDRFDDNKWIDHRSERRFDTDTLIEEILPKYSEQLEYI